MAKLPGRPVTQHLSGMIAGRSPSIDYVGMNRKARRVLKAKEKNRKDRGRCL
jgi:hypothetical protein